MKLLENFIRNTRKNSCVDKGIVLTFLGEMQQDDLDCFVQDIENLINHKNETIGLYARRKEPFNILNEYFNHKSDANKYLTASEQECLENDLHDWLIDEFYQIEF
jgi:hypothetical protein